MKSFFFLFLVFMFLPFAGEACSVLYYVDVKTGKVYAVNNEDYWYDVDAYIQIEPKTKTKYARLWYGWDNFAQGGLNDQGLFFMPLLPQIKPKYLVMGILKTIWAIKYLQIVPR